MQGCTSPLVVKIADTEREKNAKRLHGALNAVGGVNGFNSLGVSPLQAAAYCQVVCVCVCVCVCLRGGGVGGFCV